MKYSERELIVLALRSGMNLNSGKWVEKKTLEEVGKVLGVTRERVRQIEGKIFEKIRYEVKDFLFLTPNKET